MSDPVPFVELRLRGARFEDPGMPVDALTELVAYRELLIEVAKGVFLDQRPGRRRVSRGFVDRLQLRLRRIGDGSAVPVLERVDPDPGGMIPTTDEFDAARQLIEAAILAVAEGDGLPARFPATAIPYFNRFGRTLGPGETIEIRAPDSPKHATYNARVRRALILSQANTYRSQVSLLGRLAELDAEAFTFRLRTQTQGAILCHFDYELFSTLHEALQVDGSGPVVRIDGVALLDSAENILRVESVTDVSSAEEYDSAEAPSESVSVTVVYSHDSLRRQVERLTELRDGWLEGQGSAPDLRVLTAIRATLDALSTNKRWREAERSDELRLYPTAAGGVQLEWSAGAAERSVEIRPDLSAHYVDVDTDTGDYAEREFETFNSSGLFELLLGGVSA